MLLVEEVIAKFVSFIIEKTAGRLIDNNFNDKQKAARTLTKLYYCIQTLDEVTDSVIEEIENSKGNYFFSIANAINNKHRDIELSSNMFIALSQELNHGLRIIDPKLWSCCSVLYQGKHNILDYLSNSIVSDRSDGLRYIKLLRSHGKVELVDLERQYQLTSLESDNIEWPATALDDFNNHFDEETIYFERNSNIEEIYEIIKNQNTHLKNAKESLRNLLINSFPIEDILFQSVSRRCSIK